MAGSEAKRAYWGRDESIGDRLDRARIRRLTLVLLFVAAALATFHPASATARPLSSATDPMAAERPGGPFATDSGQHGIQERDPSPLTFEHRAARGVDGFAPQTHPSDQTLPARRARLQSRVHAVPPSRAAGGNSPRAPPPAA
jgi:hypothetical protein